MRFLPAIGEKSGGIYESSLAFRRRKGWLLASTIPRSAPGRRLRIRTLDVVRAARGPVLPMTTAGGHARVHDEGSALG